MDSSPDDGIRGWILRPSDGSAATPALFLDRDGVIVEEVGYLGRSESVQLIPGASEAITRANGLGVPVVVVTNQAGIGRGMYYWSGFESVNREMIRRLAEEGAWLDAIFACPFHPDAPPPYQALDHFGRKPEPGMLLRAARDLNLDLRASWIVGDTFSDIVAGRRARLEGAVLVLTGHGTRDREQVVALSDGEFPVLIAPTLGVAAAMIPFLAR
jgi:D-glycero-D-manno-heptose 1,7-bisphosphate phosphatase